VTGRPRRPETCLTRWPLGRTIVSGTPEKLGENLTGANPWSVTLNLRAGYLTGHAGKFLHWLDLGVEAPHSDRWTYFKGGYENVYMNFDGTVRRSQGYSTTIVFDRAVEYVSDFEGRDDARPFCLYLAAIALHDPYVAEPKYAAAAVPAHQPDPSYLEADRSDKPPFVRNQNPTAATVQATRTAMVRTLYRSTTTAWSPTSTSPRRSWPPPASPRPG